MAAARQGKRWDSAEEDILLDELRGENTLQEIAARHRRSPGGICARLEKLLKPEQEFPSQEALFAWARSELRKGHDGLAGWAVDRATAAPDRGHPVLGTFMGLDMTAQDDREGRTPARVRSNTLTRRDEVVAMWSAATAAHSGHQAQAPTSRAELDVLATVEDTRLHEAASAVLRCRGELNLARWVLECDWPDVESLRLTAEQILTEDEDVQRIGQELLLAGLGKSSTRDREIMRMRLGFTGEAATLDAIALRFDLSRERIRQIQNKVLERARVKPTRVRRCWHHVHDTLLAALRTAGRAELDAALVLSFVELVAPLAPREVAVTLVARLCGLGAEDCRSVVAAVQEYYANRERHRKQQLQEEKKRGRLTTKVQQILDKADWPPGHTLPAGGQASPLRPPIESNRRSNPGQWISDRLGRAIGYDSEAELRVIQMLEFADDLVASYCEQPIRLSYTLYGNRHDYYPDLLVDLRDGRRLLLEVKARIDEFALYENVVKFDAATQFCRTLGWGFAAITPRGETPADLAARPVAEHIEHVLHQHLGLGPTDWRRLYPLVIEHGIRYSDIATLVLRHSWYWHKHPFRLSTTPLEGNRRWKPLA
ncbi:TnsA endonuclease N-terminal domain-containing protein [Allokutzneria oryzae]|uniref:TnsA endonuclease N-terminal domain-containing protein n=1 Tax=Allokutzneria oryzae TaxID=1378989 RepID=A0ABV5ZT21_9PSEU